jgi:hypothetical protein
MKKTIWAVAIAAVIIAAGIALYFRGLALDAGEAASAEEPESVSPVAQTEKPAVQYPIPEDDTPLPAPELPPLDASDEILRDDLGHAFGEAPIEAFLVPGQLVRHVVATIDSLDRDAIPLRFRPIRHVPERPVVHTEGDQITLSPDNAKRYEPFISALQAADSGQIAALYLRYYPLFQRAYADLGYPDRYFNDRVIQVIDHLLAAPAIVGPIELLQPKVLYVFADPALEQRSWGQKILIRMGPANAELVKAKLREIRRLIAARGREQ